MRVHGSGVDTAHPPMGTSIGGGGLRTRSPDSYIGVIQGLYRGSIRGLYRVYDIRVI